MTTQQAKTLSEHALLKLAKALEEGQSQTLKTYLQTMSRFHRYSWGNCLLIANQRPDSTHVAGFNAWLRFNRHVRQGEKGIAILAPIVRRKKKEEESAEGKAACVKGFRVAHVFDISQTEGEPLPEFCTARGNPGDQSERLKEFVASKGIALEYSEQIAPAKGVSAGGRITLLPSLDPAEMFAVLVHEVAHELLHRGERRAHTTQRVRETEAEAVSFVVSSAIGLETDAASRDYIQLYSGDNATLAESLYFIQQAAADILQAISPASADEVRGTQT